MNDQVKYLKFNGMKHLQAEEVFPQKFNLVCPKLDQLKLAKKGEAASHSSTQNHPLTEIKTPKVELQKKVLFF